MRQFIKILFLLDLCLLTLLAFVIKNGADEFGISSDVIYFEIIILLFLLFCFKIFSAEKIPPETPINECREIKLIDFLPVITHLMCFFVGFFAPNLTAMLPVIGITLIIMFISRAFLFSPMFLLFGYHYYMIITSNGTSLIILAKGSIIRNPNDVEFEHLHRVDDMFYIQT